MPGVGNYDPLTIRLYRDLWDRIAANQDGPPEGVIEGESRSALNLLGARYLISDDDLPLPVIYDAGPRIYLNDAALPAAFVVFQARVVEDEEARLADPAGSGVRSHALRCCSASPPSSSAPRDGQATATDHQPEPSVLRPGPDRVIIQVKMDQPGYLVLTDTYYPGWRATVDGQPAEILPADHAFRAVGLEAGEHTVVFRYSPGSFRLGAWISLGATLSLAVMLIASRRRRRAG